MLCVCSCTVRISRTIEGKRVKKICWKLGILGSQHWNCQIFHYILKMHKKNPLQEHKKNMPQKFPRYLHEYLINCNRMCDKRVFGVFRMCRSWWKFMEIVLRMPEIVSFMLNPVNIIKNTNQNRNVLNHSSMIYRVLKTSCFPSCYFHSMAQILTLKML